MGRMLIRDELCQQSTENPGELGINYRPIYWKESSEKVTFPVRLLLISKSSTIWEVCLSVLDLIYH